MHRSALVEPRAERVHVIDGRLVVLDRVEPPAQHTVDVERGVTETSEEVHRPKVVDELPHTTGRSAVLDGQNERRRELDGDVGVLRVRHDGPQDGDPEGAGDHGVRRWIVLLNRQGGFLSLSELCSQP